MGYLISATTRIIVDGWSGSLATMFMRAFSRLLSPRSEGVTVTLTFSLLPGLISLFFNLMPTAFSGQLILRMIRGFFPLLVIVNVCVTGEELRDMRSKSSAVTFASSTGAFLRSSADIPEKSSLTIATVSMVIFSPDVAPGLTVIESVTTPPVVYFIGVYYR